MRLPLLLAPLLLAGCSPSDRDKPIELGHIYPPNHDDAEFRAIDLAVEDLNRDSAGRPLGRPVRVLHAPAGTKPEEAGAQAARFLALNKVKGVIGGERFDQAERVGAEVQGDGVVAVSPADWAGSPPPTNLFTVGVVPAERGRVLAKAVLERKPQSVAIVRDPAAKAANLAADAFAAACRAAGVRVLEPEAGPAKPTADVVFVAGSAKQALESRPGDGRLAVFGGGDAELPALLAGGPPADGFLVATAYSAGLQSDRLAAFVNRYREKYGRPPSAAAVLAHDAFTIWVEAVRRANTLDVGPVREQLLKREKPFDMLTGPLQFADDHTARRPVYVGTSAAGTLKDVRAFDADPAR